MKKPPKKLVIGVWVILAVVVAIVMLADNAPEKFGKNQETIDYVKGIVGDNVKNVDVIDQNNGTYDVVVTAKQTLIGSGTDWGIAAQTFFSLSKELFTKYKGKVNTLAFDLEAEGQDGNGNPTNIRWANLMTNGKKVSAVNWDNISLFQYTRNFVKMSAYNRQAEDWLVEYQNEYQNN
jgi:hypothetical protein